MKVCHKLNTQGFVLSLCFFVHTLKVDTVKAMDRSILGHNLDQEERKVTHRPLRDFSGSGEGQSGTDNQGHKGDEEERRRQRW